MKPVLALLLAALAVGFACAQDDPTGKLSGVHDLTPTDFDAIVNGRKAALIEFYAPWCGHCKRLVPEYKKLGEKVASDPKLASRVVIAKVNADEHRSLGERFGVRGFPTLKWFPRGKPKSPEDYSGGRSLSDFLKFIEDSLKADAGFARVEALVPLAKKFLAADDKEAVIAEAEAVQVSDEDQANAALYVRFMKRSLEKGSQWLTTELARLEKVLDKGTSPAKMDEISRKISVLSSFSAEEEEEDDEDEAEADEPAPAADAGAAEAAQEAQPEAEDHEEEAEAEDGAHEGLTEEIELDLNELGLQGDDGEDMHLEPADGDAEDAGEDAEEEAAEEHEEL